MGYGDDRWLCGEGKTKEDNLRYNIFFWPLQNKYQVLVIKGNGGLSEKFSAVAKPEFRNGSDPDDGYKFHDTDQKEIENLAEKLAVEIRPHYNP